MGHREIYASVNNP